MKYWEYKRKIREQERQKTLDEWDKKNRMEKIRTLKSKYEEEKTTVVRKETENNKDYENWREEKENEEEYMKNNDSIGNKENNEQKTTTEIQMFPIFMKLKKATEMKITTNKANELGIRKHNTNSPKTTTPKPPNKKTTETPKTTIKHNKITKYMKKQIGVKSETTTENNTTKAKTENNTNKTTSKNIKQQQQHENENKKLRGYWVNLAMKSKNQASKAAQSEAIQPSLISSSCNAQSYSQIQVDCERKTRGELHAPKEHSRTIRLAAPILESGD